MKIRLSYKSPDVVHYAVMDALQDEIEKRTEDGTLDEFDQEAFKEDLTNCIIGVTGSDEYVAIEVDTDTGTATVVCR